MIAIILSILFPGLGQFYLGKNWRGIAMLVLGVTPFYLVALIWSVFDIIQQNKKNPIPVFSKTEAKWIVILLFVILPVCFALLGFGSVYAVSAFQKFNQPRLTTRECNEIANAIDSFRDQTGRLPESISESIKRKPPRSGWETDAWNNPYVYSIQGDNSYTLISTGADGKLDTMDDIVVKK